jgi:hypothetical protein
MGDSEIIIGRGVNMMRYRLGLLVTLTICLQACQGTLSTATVQSPTVQIDEAQPVPLPSETPVPIIRQPGTIENSSLMFDFTSSPEDTLLRVVDLGTGKDLEGHLPLPLGQYRGYMVDDNLSMLAAISVEESECQPTCLHLVDIPRWVVDIIPLDIPYSQDLWFPSIAYDKARDRLLINSTERTRHQILYSYSIKDRQLSKLFEFAFAPLKLKFSADGNRVYFYGTQPQSTGGFRTIPWVASFDLVQDELLWQAPLPGVKDGQEQITEASGPESLTWWSPAVIFQPQGDLLRVVHAHEDQLTTVDFAHQTIQTRPILAALSWFERLLVLDASRVQAKILNGTQKQAVISPDGTRLFVLSITNDLAPEGESSPGMHSQQGRFTFLDTASGSVIEEWETEATLLSSFPGGSEIYLTGWDLDGQVQNAWTEIFTMDEPLSAHRLDGVELIPSYRLDRSPILISQNALSSYTAVISIFEPGSNTPFMEWEETSGGSYGWVILPQP